MRWRQEAISKSDGDDPRIIQRMTVWKPQGFKLREYGPRAGIE
jgi:hypothetical protein